MSAVQAEQIGVVRKDRIDGTLSENWITGDQGAAKLRFLTSNLFRKIRDAAIRDHGAMIPEYLPWLSCKDRAGKIGVFSIIKPKRHILTDSEILRKLRKTYWLDRSAPLGGLSIKSDCMSIDVRAAERDLTTLQRAIQLVVTVDDSWQQRFDSLARMIVPLKTIGKNVRRGGVGFSSEYAKGAIFLSIPRQKEFPEIELSINLAHEMGHQALMTYQAADQIIDGDLGLPVYSGVRKTNRPAIQSFHAMIALAFMVEYVTKRMMRGHLSTDAAYIYLGQQKKALVADFDIAIKAFDGIALTPIGQKLYGECQELLRSVRGGELR